jgi:transposase
VFVNPTYTSKSCSTCGRIFEDLALAEAARLSPQQSVTGFDN